jgi:hypothetical protein
VFSDPSEELIGIKEFWHPITNRVVFLSSSASSLLAPANDVVFTQRTSLQEDIRLHTDHHMLS